MKLDPLPEYRQSQKNGKVLSITIPPNFIPKYSGDMLNKLKSVHPEMVDFGSWHVSRRSLLAKTDLSGRSFLRSLKAIAFLKPQE